MGWDVIARAIRLLTWIVLVFGLTIVFLLGAILEAVT